MAAHLKLYDHVLFAVESNEELQFKSRVHNICLHNVLNCRFNNYGGGWRVAVRERGLSPLRDMHVRVCCSWTSARGPAVLQTAARLIS